MSIQDYFFSEKTVNGLGNLYFLKVLQTSDKADGSHSLLGSVVKEVRDKFLVFVSRRYPVPYHMSVPGLLMNLIQRNKDKFGISDAVIDQPLAKYAQSIKFEKKHILSTGIGPLPGLPLEAGIDIDNERTLDVTLAFEDARLVYIPLGYYAMLYQEANGNADLIDTSGMLKDNFVVDQVLVAQKFNVTFSSSEKFDKKFNAKLEEFSKVPKVGASVEYKSLSDTSIVAKIDSQTWYMVALSVCDWDDFDHK